MFLEYILSLTNNCLFDQNIVSAGQSIYKPELEYYYQIEMWRLIAVLTLTIRFKNSQQVCHTGQAPFPKLVGGSHDFTSLYAIDYTAVTEYLVAAGYTKDQGVRGDALGGSVYRPIIIAYQSAIYAWGKVFTSLGDDIFYGVKINRLGTKLVVANELSSRYLIVMDIANGNVLKATKPYAVSLIKEYLRILLLLDDDTILVGDYYEIYKLAPPATSAIKYRMTSGSPTPIVRLQTNSAQNRLHVFTLETPYCQITVMNLPSFTVVYQYQAQCVSTDYQNMGKTFQACVYESSSTVDTIVFQEGNRYFRMDNQYSTTTFTPSTVYDGLTTGSYKAKGLYCLSANQVYSIIYWRASSSSNMYRTYIASVNFNTNTISFKMYMQEIQYLEINNGVIFGADKFYASIDGYQIFTSATTSFYTRTSQWGVIYSSYDTCQYTEQSLKDSLPAQSLTVDTYPLSIFSHSQLSFAITVTDLSSSLPTTSPLVSSEFEGLYASQCNMNQYSGLSSTQTTTALAFFLEDTYPKAVHITAFSASKIYDTYADPVFTYTLVSFSGPANAISVTGSTGDIVIPDVAVLGAAAYTVVIEGKLQDCQTMQVTFTLTGQPNTAPIFKGIVGLALSDISASQEKSVQFSLPKVFDPDTSQSVSVSLLDPLSTAYPLFVVFTSPQHTAIKLSPTITTPIATYSLQVVLNDGITSTQYSLRVAVSAPVANAVYAALINTGGPIFDEEIQSEIRVNAGRVGSYTLPTISDPDNDKFECSVSLGSTSPFVTYSDRKFSFKPQLKQVSDKPYTITVTLKDLNPAGSKSTKYQIRIIVSVEVIVKPPEAAANTTQPSNSTKTDNSTSSQDSSSSSPSSNSSSNFSSGLTDEEEDSASPYNTGGSKGNTKGGSRVIGRAYANLKMVEVTGQGEVKVKIVAQFKKEIFKQFTNNSFKIKVASREDNQLVNYTIMGLSSNTITLKLGYANPTALSKSQTFDTLQIVTAQEIQHKSQYLTEILKKDITLQSFIPAQITTKEAEERDTFQKTSEYASYALVSSNLLLNLFLSGLLSYLFGLLNDISQLVMLQLININIPGRAQMIMSILMNLIYMDLLQTNLWLDKILNIEDDGEALCPSFDLAGYSTLNSVSNLGSTFVFIFILVTLYAVFALLKPVKQYLPTRLANLYKKWNDVAFWNLPVRFFIQQYQAILISSLLSIALNLNNYQTQSFKESIDSYGKRFSVFLGIILLIVSFGFPLLLVKIIYKHRRELQTSEFNNKYGTVLEDLRLGKNDSSIRDKIVPYFNIIVLYRWGIQISVLVLLSEFLALQILISLVLSIAFTIIVFQLKPYESHVGYISINENYFKVFNEAIVIYYLIVMMMLTDLIYDNDEIRLFAGLCQFSIIFVSVFCNILKSAVIGINVLLLKREIKRRELKNIYQKKRMQYQFKRKSQFQKSLPTKGRNLDFINLETTNKF
ncbi:hypothetical protein FGO68_gene16476 [Halteria grandinella]|uniref:Uncharacterized protein n=1 Tax=Halteria grandinella TaxID=5974 RepID=A0A8J8P3V3_HALGN|nr:hypothetical protein FGO68_gene16476 [Halteria grandinella]